MKSAIVILAIAILVYELVEHVVFPVFWLIKIRKKRSICGMAGMIGKIGEIKCWQESEGKIFVNGELWRAVSQSALSPGDKAVVQHVEGLTLRVMPDKKDNV